MSFQTDSYESHRRITHDSLLTETWHNEKTVDFWRHQRMYHQIDSILKAYPQSTWLTVGDGRYGTDANYLSRFGVNVLASDINDIYLKQAKEQGFISDYSIENAENLSFADNQFDFVLCKESYHHFPRPTIALYEMLRVAKTGIILIEPNDQSIIEPYQTTLHSLWYWFFFGIKQWIKQRLGKAKASFPTKYEPVGNFVYSISRRELEKVALGLNFDALATKCLNDFYLDGIEHEEVERKGPLFKKIKESIDLLDKTSAKRPEASGLLIGIIFKTLPTEECLGLLRENKFKINILEKNPYIKS